jgi:DASH complex subunit ASK1
MAEIDENFSRAHRIVTGSILPIVQNYRKHSESVWEGSKFWMKFFEASANIQLHAYEEAPDNEQKDIEQGEGLISTVISETYEDSDTTEAPKRTLRHENARMTGNDSDEDLESTLILSSPSVVAAHSTPKQKVYGPASDAVTEGIFANYGSPYENLKKEVRGASQSTEQNPVTPAKSHVLSDTSSTPLSSPFGPHDHTNQENTAPSQSANDPMMHRMLDKVFRIAATPIRSSQKPTIGRPKSKPSTGLTPITRTGGPSLLDSSPIESSPFVAVPQLRADIFNSPYKQTPRTPGVSILTAIQRQSSQNAGAALSAKGYDNVSQKRTNYKNPSAFPNVAHDELWVSDEDLTEDLGLSPPKTMQFHIPQSKLLQTPGKLCVRICVYMKQVLIKIAAREAAKRTVENLLLTAGGDMTDEYDEGRMRAGDEDSPSVVKRNAVLDDSF